MTSEILIINKNAIAMAADSAVTVGNKKTYMGVNKLFMLSNNPPMGIMIFGSANFGRVPMETLIKEFRSKTNFEQLANIENIKNEFLSYLDNISNRDTSIDIFKKLDEFKDYLIEYSNKCSDEKWNNLINSIKNGKSISFFEKDEVNKKKYYDEIEIISSSLTDNRAMNEDLVEKCFCEALIDASTGIVIAGFNETDFFPSFISFKLFKDLEGNLISSDEHSEINFKGSAIIPFAQQDVINNFIYGISDQLNAAIVKFFSNFIDGYLDELIDSMKSNNKLNGKDLNTALSEVKRIKSSNGSRVMDLVNTINQFKNMTSNPIFKSIDALPKDELANMAESMIHITSLKRKIASDLESVGGDIDVALISKGDGFIWKKRKHYFKAELNPHFFDRNKE